MKNLLKSLSEKLNVPAKDAWAWASIGSAELANTVAATAVWKSINELTGLPLKRSQIGRRLTQPT